MKAKESLTTFVRTVITKTVELDQERVEDIVRDYIKREYGFTNVDVDFVGAKYEGCSANCVVTYKKEEVDEI